MDLGTFRRRFLLSTTMLMGALTGYARQAYAACVNTAGSTYLCSGANATTQTINHNNATVSTDATFSVNTSSGNAITITGDAVSYTDLNYSSLTASYDGLHVALNGTNLAPATPGYITIDTNGAVSAGHFGISAYNQYGSGALSITANGDVSGGSGTGFGIYAKTKSSTDADMTMTITTGAGTTVSGGFDGIITKNYGVSAQTITVNGDVTSTYNAINLFNGANTGNLDVTTGAGTTVSGGQYGIEAQNFGSGSTLALTINGRVTGTNADGIYARGVGTDTTVTTELGSTVLGGGNDGIYALNQGTGVLTVTANGDVTGTSRNGIFAYNKSTTSTNLYVTTGAGHTVSGGKDGISAVNSGSGALTITANGNVTGTGRYGINALNNAAGADLNITTGTGSTISGYASGIYAKKEGSGALIITADGDVSGTDTGSYGIKALNNAGTDLKVTTGAGYTVSGGQDGISAINSGTGTLTINVDGVVTGTNRHGIFAVANNATGAGIAITTGAGAVSGAVMGIDAENDGGGALAVTANGDVTGASKYGIRAFNSSAGSSLSVTTGEYTTVKGYVRGLYAKNNGNGALTIIANGDVTGLSGGSDGIFAYNNTGGTYLHLKTGTDTTVSGGANGIFAKNLGSDALTITANGDVTATAAGSKGIFAYNKGPGLTVTTAADTTVSGDSFGIYARNVVSGALNITADGNVSGTDTGSYGIKALNSAGTDLAVTTGAGKTVSGGKDGIVAENYGNGVLTIAANGNVTGTSDTGIFARNAVGSSYLAVTTGTGTTVSGGFNGITAFNNSSSGALTITANGDVTGGNTGIYAQNAGTDLDVTTGTATTVYGSNHGIIAKNLGIGTLTVTANGNVTGASGYGIFAIGNAAGTDPTVTTGTGTTVSGSAIGIVAKNYGSGALTITANGDVTGTAAGSYGIFAYNKTGTVSGGKDGIIASNVGTGALTIDAYGDVSGTGTSGYGIKALNNAGTYLKVTTGAGYTVSGGKDGIYAKNQGRGALTITVNGDVIGTSGAGIYAKTGGTHAYITVAAAASVTSNGSGANSYGMQITGGPGTVTVAGTVTGGTAGTIAFDQGTAFDDTLTVEPSTTISGTVLAGPGTDSLVFSGNTGTGSFNVSALGAGQQFQSFEALAKEGASHWIMTGSNTDNLTFAVNGGLLSVNATMPNTAFTVNAGATLGGNNTIGSTVINGGTLAPGNSVGTINVNGNLSFTSSSIYQVQVEGPNADRTNVSGQATLAGTVQTIFTPGGGSLAKSYTILSAAGGLNGTFDSLTLSFSGNVPGFTLGLSYTTNDVLLTLTPLLGMQPGSNFNQNQQHVATGLDDYFSRGGALPSSFVNVFGLSASSQSNALSQLSGETGTGVQQASFQSMQQFLTLMLDPFVPTRGGAAGAAGGPALAFASAPAAASSLPPEVTRAYAQAMPVKTTPLTFAQRWNAWGAGFGGNAQIDGDAVVGSHDTDTSTAGLAAGADYRLSPDTVLGFAVAGGNTRWSLSGGLGSGRSDFFQAGAYGSHRMGPAYVSAAVAYGWHRASTTRTVTASGSETLEADFHPQVFGSRVETGYRFGGSVFGVTPYAAGQVQTFLSPGYSETATAGSGTFALGYQAQTTTIGRSELGLWTDFRHMWNGPAGKCFLQTIHPAGTVQSYVRPFSAAFDRWPR